MPDTDDTNEGLPPLCGYRYALEADLAAELARALEDEPDLDDADLDDEEPDEGDAMRWTPPDDAAVPEAPADFSRTITHS
jgi:hypothetical protein